MAGEKFTTFFMKLASQNDQRNGPVIGGGIKGPKKKKRLKSCFKLHWRFVMVIGMTQQTEAS